VATSRAKAVDIKFIGKPTTSEQWEAVAAELAKPFPPASIKVKPGKVSGSRAMVLFFINARDVMDRFDQVVGAQNWEFAWDQLEVATISVKGYITVYGDPVRVKSDVGEAEKEDEVWKSAVSDALKRTAVHWGVGRFLYEMGSIWWDFDPQSKKFKAGLDAEIEKIVGLKLYVEVAPVKETAAATDKMKKRNDVIALLKKQFGTGAAAQSAINNWIHVTTGKNSFGECTEVDFDKLLATEGGEI
jgi:hypothetical protein